MPAESDIAALIVKYLREQLTEEERKELVNWMDQSPDHLQFLEGFLSRERYMEKLKIFSEMDEAGIWKKLMGLIK